MFVPRHPDAGAPGASVTPIAIPPRHDLWQRIALAKAVLGHRPLTPATAALLLRVLDGERIENLVEGRG